MNAGKIGAGIIGGALVVSILALPLCTEKINAGYAGVVYNQRGGIENELLSQGRHFISPFQRVREYSVSIEQGYLSKDEREGSETDESFTVPTKDGKQVNVDLEFAYNFIAEKLPDTYTKFKGQDGKLIEDTFIKGKIKAWTADVTSKYSVLDIYGEKRSEINKSIIDYIKPKFEAYGINMESVNLSRVEPDDQTAKAIQERVNAQQSLEKVKIDKEKAVLEAEKKKIEAQGEADSKLIRAQGEAASNDKLQQSLTPELVEYKKMEKWDGKLPQVSGGSSIVDIRE